LLKGLSEKEGNFNKAKAIFGGRLRMIVCGSAPASPSILLFFADSLGLEMREGYGQTESLAASFVTYPGDRNYGHVGGPNRVT
jgi:long-chain acyl-CoA synthetase